MTRWPIATAAVATHLCLGSVYAWSVFVAPIQKVTGWTQPQLTWAFSFAIATLGLTAALGGPLLQRLGPRKSVGMAATLFGVGMAGAGFAVMQHSLVMLYLLFGVVGGMGLGMAYAPPVAALLKWFPDRKGLATGIGVCGFGLGALVATKVAEPMLGSSLGCVGTFYVLGVAYLVVMFVASRFLALPPEDWRPTVKGEGWRSGAVAALTAESATVGQALGSLRFWLLWLLFYINICAGILFLALAKPMGKDVAHLTEGQGMWLVAIMGLFNGGGRLAWSVASDRLGRTLTFGVMLSLQVALFVILAKGPTAFWFMGCIWLIVSCYGGGFAITPAFLADMFGSRNTGTIYGAILTAWGAAALSSPALGAHLKEVTHGYDGTLYVLAGALLLAWVVNVLLWRCTRKTQGNGIDQRRTESVAVAH